MQLSPHVQLSPQEQAPLHVHVSPQLRTGEQVQGDAQAHALEIFCGVCTSAVDFMTNLVFGLC